MRQGSSREEVFFMLDELLEIFDRDDDNGNRRGRRNAPARQGGIRGFLGRLFGQDDEDDEDLRADRGDMRYRDRDVSDEERVGGSEGRNRRRDRNDDGGGFELDD
jgi:hypothetical protein